jgi:outer membrane biogenesis lipoprotein LolB
MRQIGKGTKEWWLLLLLLLISTFLYACTGTAGHSQATNQRTFSR